MSLRAEVALHLGSLDLEARIEATPAETVALVGPNGAGKTTFLRSLAGLVAVDRGRVSVDGVVLEDPEAGVRLAPEERPVAVVFQDHLLFPHLSALDNVAYGLRASGAHRSDARQRARRWLERLGAADHSATRPRALSGGQAQRVALARALATEPAVLLLDEPLAAIDATSKAQLRRELRAELAHSPGVRIIVTHDPVDAIALADHLVVLEAGRITQQGRISDVTARPRSPWVAALVGLNLYEGRAERASITLADGRALSVVGDVRGPAFALVHPRAVTLYRSRPEGSARNVWEGEALALDVQADRARVQVAGTPPVVAEVTHAAAEELRLREGGRIWVSVKATEIDVYPA
jgi:molybdate transport system ATP-binding protein